MPAHSSADVRRHYAELAPAYEDRSNAACGRAYATLIRRTMAGARRVLEVGAGSQSLLPVAGGERQVAIDVSQAMLAAQRAPVSWHRVVADAQAMPFSAGSFDGVYAINVLEHVPDPVRLVEEAERVLAPGGRMVAVTPNGDLERLLDLLERLHLKLPEGPHRFLRFAELGAMRGRAMTVLEHRRFLALPAGPRWFVEGLDGLVAGRTGRGLFQYVVLQKPSPDVEARA